MQLGSTPANSGSNNRQEMQNINTAPSDLSTAAPASKSSAIKLPRSEEPSSELGAIMMEGEIATTLAATLEARNLPRNLKQRLLQDSINGMPHYTRLNSVLDIQAKPANSGYMRVQFGCLAMHEGQLIHQGTLGRYRDSDEFHFLAPGYHNYTTFGSEYLTPVSVNQWDEPVTNGPGGFIIISESHIGVMVVAGEYRLLAPGVYQWFTAAVTGIKSVDISLQGSVMLGPYTLLTVEVGDAAVTYNHGTLRVLGQDVSNSVQNATTAPLSAKNQQFSNPFEDLTPAGTNSGNNNSSNGSRTFFLDDPRWYFKNMLSLRRQTDRLEGNDLLSKDNVEVLLVAMAQWRVVDAHACASECATGMDQVRKKVDSLVRATIARIVAGSTLGQGGGSHTNAGHVGVDATHHAVVAAAASSSKNSSSPPAAAVTGGEPTSSPAAAKPTEPGHGEDNDGTLAHVMLSEVAITHMNELKLTMQRLGIEVFGVYIPEKRIKSDETRRAVASQAVIGIQAEQHRSSADAEAYATTVAARAEAESITVVSEAHKRAGDMLGPSHATGAKLALVQQTAKALKPGTQVTLFADDRKGGSLPYLLAPEDRM